MKKKIFVVFLIGILGISLVACNKENTADASVAESEKETAEIIQERQKEEPQQEEEQQEETQQEETEREEQPKDEASEKEEEKTYEDNFAVDSEAAAAFAREIKEAVANQDLEALADLASYPLYVGFSDGGVSVNSKDELISFGAEKIFTPEMMNSIENADESNLSPSKAGFALSAEGRPNMVFGVVDGKLAIQGMNW